MVRSVALLTSAGRFEAYSVNGHELANADTSCVREFIEYIPISKVKS